MTIRKIDKDHLQKFHPHVVSIESTDSKPENQNPLVFWTLHDTKACLVDLTDLALGQARPKKAGLEERWSGPYTGRPSLIDELAPAIREKLVWAAERTCQGLVANLKSWWRLFDDMERENQDTGLKVQPVSCVRDLTHLHHQLAVQKFSANTFSAFRSIADATRRALGEPPLAWVGPGERSTTRRLPTPDQARQLFLHIKREWLDAVDRWNMVENLRTGTQFPENDRQVSLHRNALYFIQTQETLSAQGKYYVTVDDLLGGWSTNREASRAAMARAGLSTQVMHEAIYPTSTDIRMAFHLALIGGGWNVQTLLDLNVKSNAIGSARTPFLKDHPQNSDRYILTGFKSRGKSDQILHGDWKADRSPGRIIRLLVERTWPLRLEILDQLKDAQIELKRAHVENTDQILITRLKKHILELQRKSTSVWLYIGKGSIEALSATTFDKNARTAQFLRQIIDRINERKSNIGSTENLPGITASDFRDIFAEYVYRTSGGSVLAVKRLLGHRSLDSTTKYLNNSVINQEGARIFVRYTNAFWNMVSVEGGVDHTVLRQVTEQGMILPIHMVRLDEYRGLKRSRIKMGCRDPQNPPARLDPFFIADGKEICTMQRCTLCEHGVLTPESFEGLTMRFSELAFLKARIPIEYFTRGGDISFQAEMNNTEAALKCFDPEKVQKSMDMWAERLSKGIHRMPEFNGIARMQGIG